METIFIVLIKPMLEYKEWRLNR